MRDVADGRATNQQRERFKSLTLGSHPPPWLRLERARLEIEKALSGIQKSDAAIEFSQIADGLIENVDLIWLAVQDELPRSIKGARVVREKERLGQELSETQLRAMADQLKADSRPSVSPERAFRPGCARDPSRWLSTFFCTAALQKAAVGLLDGDATDVQILTDYAVAISSDPILLGGGQLLWAQDTLERNRTEDREIALAVVALSGDRDGLRTLDSVTTVDWPEDARRLLTRARVFLKQHGRDTTVKALASLNPAAFALSELLVYPMGLPGANPQETASRPMSAEQLAFVASARAVDPSRSLASMALYMLQAKTAPAAVYSFWSDVLLRGGFVEPALRLAMAGADRVGPDGGLENAIGNILSKQGKLAEANTHYEASLRAGRNDGWPEVNLAKNFAELQQYDSAESWFRKAITKRDSARSLREFAGYLNEFAWFIVTRRKEDSAKVREALAVSREANDLVKRSDANFLDTLAECEAASGNFGAAVDAARAALALIEPASPERPQYERRLAEFEARARKQQ